MWMPSLISLMIMDLDSSKSWFVSVPMECVWLEELSKWLHALGARKGDETRLMRPNYDRTSVMVIGVGKSLMASRYFLHGRTL